MGVYLEGFPPSNSYPQWEQLTTYTITDPGMGGDNPYEEPLLLNFTRLVYSNMPDPKDYISPEDHPDGGGRMYIRMAVGCDHPDGLITWDWISINSGVGNGNATCYESYEDECPSGNWWKDQQDCLDYCDVAADPEACCVDETCHSLLPGQTCLGDWYETLQECEDKCEGGDGNGDDGDDGIGGPGGDGDEDDPDSGPAGGDDCEVCPMEVVCIQWTACRQDHDGNDMPETECKRCMTLPVGSASAINGMKVNACCDSWENVEEDDYDDACATGGRYTATAMPGGPCTQGEVLYSELPPCISIMNKHCAAGGHGDCPYSGSTFECDANGLNYTNSGCCNTHNMPADYGDIGYGDGVHFCNMCDTGATCVQCDGCNDYGSHGGCAEPCMRIPCKKNLGRDCTSSNQGDGGPLEGFQCFGSCDMECSKLSGSDIYHYYANWLCDCIDSGMKPEDECCPGGVPAEQDAQGWVCRDDEDGNTVYPLRPSSIGITKCSCAQLRCGGSTGLLGGGDDVDMGGLEQVLLNGECIWMMDPPENLQRCDT